MIPVSELFGSEVQKYEKLADSIMFRTHVCLPCIIQSYNPENNTIEAQPTVRERFISENGKISYMDYPLLINVPVVRTGFKDAVVSFPINQGDECLVIFSDVSFDYWWMNGGINNPVEQRRHDLSDGFAILGINNLKVQSEINRGDKPPDADNMLSIYNYKHGVGIQIGEDTIYFNAWVGRPTSSSDPTLVYSLETYTMHQILQACGFLN